ncbi:MAG: ATP-grasp domain-containing protein [Bacteroides sp.]|uniref:ATP-grasp domain-containing protein n=1 Tax=Bacteroides sp. TaxID=29523 RepID=UPI0026E0991F|nr:ATP-grasp domain-containing protein [Bacteroides sp.]MDO5420519.1 ATP-grasp domain-containing protein [Bacteroides sp.]
MKKRLAIIGASTGQLPLCQKAHEMGLETFCFAWPKGAICKDYVDHFIPISIFEMDEIVCHCRKYGIDGVVSNASETTALVVSYVAEKLGKVCVPYETFLSIQDKVFVRCKTNAIPGLTPVKYEVGSYDIISSFPKPYVMKPIRGAAKRGVNFVDNTVVDLVIPDDLKDAVFMAEEYVVGKEYSVEAISYNGKHEVIQITEKIGSGAPHFVELEHHQPATLLISVENKIKLLIPQILSAISFTNGASHTEIKIDDNENLYLIEVNPRGGGDYISNILVGLSTDCDYLKQMILVALDMYEPIVVHNTAYAGVYFLSAYTDRLLPYFDIPKEEWMVMRERTGKELTFSCSNYDRNGFILYSSNKKIIL